MAIGKQVCVLGGLASSAWHIDQMGQPPRLGCLGMCTGQCAVVAVSSKCWRSMLALDMSAPAYTIDEANIACVGAGGLLVEARRRNAGECREASEVVGERRWSMSVRRDVAGDRP